MKYVNSLTTLFFKILKRFVFPLNRFDFESLMMQRASTAYRVLQCSECPGDTEYSCVSCQCNICLQCKENHVKDLKTKDHTIVLYCYNSTQHKNKIQVDVNKDCNTKLQEHKEIIHIVRSDALFNRRAILAGINADRYKCHTEISFFSSDMLAKAHRLKNLIDKVKKKLCTMRYVVLISNIDA